MKHDIVITGEGILCAIGTDKQQVLQSLQACRTGIRPMRHLQSVHRELPVGEVPLSDDDMRRLLALEHAEYVSRTTLMAMLAVRQALADAAVDSTSLRERPRRVILVSGTTVAGMDVTERYFADMLQSGRHLGALLNHSAGRGTEMIAGYFGIFSDYTTVSTACSSAANALLLGARLLADGQADLVVAGGSEALSVFHLNGFRSLMIVDPQPCRPFDETRAGLNLGEGAAYVVLETGEHARQRRAPVHAWLRGYGNACDAFHPTASSANGQGAFLAMTEALRSARLEPADIDYVNAHGTGTPDNDRSESVALQRVFGSHLPPVGSTKAFTGHTTSASGSIEAVICLLALRHQFVPASLGCTRPLAGGIRPTQGIARAPLRHVLCNAFGFGGNDTSLLFSAEPSTPSSLNSHCNATLSKRESSMFNATPHSQGENVQCSINPVRELARVEITSESALTALRRYVKPLEARRMGLLMKSSLLASLQALEAAGIARPDAIVTATSLGCLEPAQRLLQQLADGGEHLLSPTDFMQSTHNTIGTHIAIHTGCHGYNTTYSQQGDSLAWALRDARMLLRSGRYRHILVGLHDAAPPLYRQLMARQGVTGLPPVHSLAIVLSCTE